ncbi:MAG TPA: M13-type metalloendopeptidase [Terriglobales bacterium]|nr:M13-type metalloendopeptidase [Terriglobales bacterium]
MLDSDWFANGVAMQRWWTERTLRAAGTSDSVVPFALRTFVLGASYSPAANDISISRILLRPPFFDAALPAPINFARLGAIYGHEIGHSVDRQSRFHPAGGGFSRWWREGTMAGIEAREECVSTIYTEKLRDFVPEEIARDPRQLSRLVERSAREALADHIGLRSALAALREWQKQQPSVEAIAGWSPEQAFFLAYSQLWCQSPTSVAEDLQALHAVHPPGPARINAALATLPEFGEAFGCAVGSKMRPLTQCVTP